MELTFKKARLVCNANAAAGEDCDNLSDNDSDISENDFGWWALPEPALLQIFSRLNAYDLLQAGLCCRRWNSISNDDLLWRQKFQENFRASPSIPLKPGAASWRAEYQRLSTHIPFVQAQRLEPTSEQNHGHTHQVLHVSFAHNGEMFATCSKDGYVIIWNAQHPCTGEREYDLLIVYLYVLFSTNCRKNFLLYLLKIKKLDLIINENQRSKMFFLLKETSALFIIFIHIHNLREIKIYSMYLHIYIL